MARAALFFGIPSAGIAGLVSWVWHLRYPQWGSMTLADLLVSMLGGLLVGVLWGLWATERPRAT